MQAHDLLVENPFRVTGLPSLTQLTQVKVALRRLTVQEKAGLGRPQPLEQVLGRADLGEVARTVRESEDDKSLQVAFRLLWPLHSPPTEDASDLGGACAQLLPQCQSDPQAAFLFSWLSFLTGPDGGRAANVQQSWSGLTTNSVVRALLSQKAGATMGGLEQGIALATRYLATTMLLLGEKLWKQVYHEDAVALLERALQMTREQGASLDLGRWLEIAEEEQAEIRGLGERAPADGEVLRRVQQLFNRQKRLLTALGSSTAEGEALARGLARVADEVGRALRDRGCDLNNDSRYREAQALLKAALELPVTNEARRLLHRELSTVESNLAVASRSPGRAPTSAGARHMSTGAASGGTAQHGGQKTDGGAASCLGCLALLGLPMLFQLFGGLSGDSTTPTASPSPTPPAIVAPASPPEPSEESSVRSSLSSNELVDEYRGLTKELDALEPQMQQAKSDIEALSAQADRLEQEIQSAKSREYSMSSWEVDEANRKIDQFNGIVAQYETRRSQYNELVAKFNGLLEQAKALEPELRRRGRLR